MFFRRFCFFFYHNSTRIKCDPARNCSCWAVFIGPCYHRNGRTSTRMWSLWPPCFKSFPKLKLLSKCELALLFPLVISILLNMPTNGILWNFINGTILVITLSKVWSKLSLRNNLPMFVNSVSNTDLTVVDLSNTVFRPFIISFHTTRNAGSLSTFRVTYNMSPSVCATTSFVVTSITASYRPTMALCAAGLRQVFLVMSWITFSVRTLVSSVTNDARLECSVFSIPHTPWLTNTSRSSFA